MCWIKKNALPLNISSDGFGVGSIGSTNLPTTKLANKYCFDKRRHLVITKLEEVVAGKLIFIPAYCITPPLGCTRWSGKKYNREASTVSPHPPSRKSLWFIAFNVTKTQPFLPLRSINSMVQNGNRNSGTCRDPKVQWPVVLNEPWQNKQ